MKLINYKRGYIDTFDCVIHGTLEVNLTEWTNEIIPILKKTCKYKNFSECMKNFIYSKVTYTKTDHYYYFGVTPIEKIVKKYKLDNYKKGNYQIKVIFR